MNIESEITHVISNWAATIQVSGKSGKRLLQPTLAFALREAGFTADEEDQLGLFRPGMPAWRSKDSQEVEPTPGRRRVDIIAYRDAMPVALLETESDLNDLRSAGTTRRSGHYDVWSISRGADGFHFHSYKSLERMAAAAFYWALHQRTGRYPSASEAVKALDGIRSDECNDHNPGRVPLFLISGSCRPQDRSILGPRLRCLGARLICVQETLGAP